MRKLLLLAGAAAMAAAMPASAEKGGKGGGKGKPQASHVQGGGGKQARGGGQGRDKPQRAERQASRGNGAQRPDGQAFRPAKAERGPKLERQAFRPDKAERGPKLDRRGGGRETKREDRFARERDRDRGNRVDLRAFRDGDRRFVSLDDACPPGLAKKGNGCLPPGQAKQRYNLGDRVQQIWFSGYDLPVRYRSFYYDTPEYYYRYDDDGYIYRIDADESLIASIIPLFGGGFAVGQPIPAGYDIYNVPYAYRDVYYDTDDYNYRYGDNAIYRVNGGSGLIESVVSLLAGDLMVGQTLPSDYDVYNVPLDYRDQYYDSDEHLYRYADGGIYQIDPQTMLIEALVEHLI